MYFMVLYIIMVPTTNGGIKKKKETEKESCRNIVSLTNINSKQTWSVET